MTTRGSEFREQVAHALDLEGADPVWLALLDETCRQMDFVDRLEANVADALLTTEGSVGQVRANPLLPELRQQRLALARLLAQLGTDDAAETTSQRQSRYARKRWS